MDNNSGFKSFVTSGTVSQDIINWLNDTTDGELTFDFDGSGSIECVDMAKRYLNEVFEIDKSKLMSMGDGWTFANTVLSRFNNLFTSYTANGSRTGGFLPGDIMSMKYMSGANSRGHVWIVKSVDTDSFTVIEGYSQSGGASGYNKVHENKYYMDGMTVKSAATNKSKYLFSSCARPINPESQVTFTETLNNHKFKGKFIYNTSTLNIISVEIETIDDVDKETALSTNHITNDDLVNAETELKKSDGLLKDDIERDRQKA